MKKEGIRKQPATAWEQGSRQSGNPILGRFLQRIRQVTDAILKCAGVTHVQTFITLKNYTTAQLLAGQGLGITMVPLQYSRLTVRQSSPALLSIHEKYAAYWDMCIATLRGSFLSKADQLFIRCIREFLQTDNEL